MNPYRILGVSDNASIDVCKKAYRRLCARYHPDSTTGNRDKFDEVQKAWGMIENGFKVFQKPMSRCLTHRSLFNFVEVSQ